MISHVESGPPSTPVCGVVDGKGGWRFGWAAMKVKGVGEVLLLQHYACQLLLYGLAVGLCFVLRRVAYFRHVRLANYISDATGVNVSDVAIREQADHFRLRDVLFELIPDRSSSPGFGLTGDLLALGVCVLAGSPLAFGASFYHRQKQQDVYTVSILVRFLRFIAILEILRPAFYLWTSLPAPDINCIASSEEQDAKPQVILEALYVDSLVSQGCGDLIYSGHVSIAVGSLLIHHFYVRRVFGEQLGSARWLYFALLVALTFADCYFIVAARHHYTVDIVSAVVTTVLVWNALGSRFGWEDMHPLHLVATRTRNGLPPSSTTAQHVGAWPTERVRQPPWKGVVGAWAVIIINACLLLYPMYKSVQMASLI